MIQQKLQLNLFAKWKVTRSVDTGHLQYTHEDWRYFLLSGFLMHTTPMEGEERVIISTELRAHLLYHLHYLQLAKHQGERRV